MIEERFESYVYEIMKYVKYQENKPYIESILEDMKYTLFREDREYIKELQQENKQLKELKYKFFDNCGEEESFTLEDYLEISNKLYDYEQENKQLKEELENIKDFNNKLQASKDRLDKDDYNLAHILTELEEYLTKIVETGASIEKLTCSYILVYLKELKEKYK